MSTQDMTAAIVEFLKTQPVEKAWLFGSFARGEETPHSDVDILVRYDSNSRITLMTISRMMGALEQAIQRPVDLVEEDPVPIRPDPGPVPCSPLSGQVPPPFWPCCVLFTICTAAVRPTHTRFSWLRQLHSKAESGFLWS